MHTLQAYRLLRFIVLSLLILAGCTDESSRKAISTLEQVRANGVLHVLTRNTPATFFQDKNGDSGFEYELVKRFAEHISVRLHIETNDNIDQLFDNLASSKQPAIIAAGISYSARREHQADFSNGYLEVVPQIVYHGDNIRPRQIKDLIGSNILVLKGSTQEERLLQLQQEHPELIFNVSDQLETVDLIRMVEERQIDYTLVNSNELALNRVYFPNIQLAFSLQPSIELQWAISKPQQKDDHSLQQAINNFLKDLDEQGVISNLAERYYGHVDTLGYVGVNAFAKHLQIRLPLYEAAFRKSAKQFDLDWRLLAATAYQESHWAPEARSKTGVRGIMMLTLRTSKEVGVANRLDPIQSIRGGAQYLAQMLERLPDSIREQDRIWFALAAYNVGLGHLEDARILTEQAGLDANSWIDVRSILPRLAQKQWYSQTKFGYARGGEPVHYVNNIRRYYDILNWVSQPQPEDGLLGEQIHSPGISNAQESNQEAPVKAAPVH